jgi:hypothetical protein
MYAYIVRCIFEEEAPRQGFLQWLRERHIADVCKAGAIDVELVLLDDENNNLSIEIRYRFESQAAFKRYETEDAPRLRAEGLAEAKRLGVEPNNGIKFARATGEILPARVSLPK